MSEGKPGKMWVNAINYKFLIEKVGKTESIAIEIKPTDYLESNYLGLLLAESVAQVDLDNAKNVGDNIEDEYWQSDLMTTISTLQKLRRKSGRMIKELKKYEDN